MSRAFVKEDDPGQAPIVPPRAAIPAGMLNYVTPTGLELLRAELMELENEKSGVEADHSDEAERTRKLSILNSKLSALNERIASARLIDPKEQPTDEVRFGATIVLKTIKGVKPGMIRKFTIVGVDEASIADGKIAFVAPIARAVIGKKAGQTAFLQLGKVLEEVRVESIMYQ